ncbi:MAG: aldehyde ferredoxin oxidoreductase family protein [Desulfamplus sp.]|nr:aldehyde ferredoxin oxidoreductase family protein [Desulfamplus sp.]
MYEIKGYSNRVLEIDLTHKSWQVSNISREDRQNYMGGKGLGMKLLYDRLEPGVDPLGKDNILVVMPGVLTGTGAPCSGRFQAISKSPLTNIIATASCGGPFGLHLKTAGYGALIIKGRSEDRCMVYFDHENVEFRDAQNIWGLDTEEAQRIMAPEAKKEAALVIGPAGENLVRFANISSGHRFLGRGGLGAVMGSKNLKGVVAAGRHYKIVPANDRKFQKVKKKANLFIKRDSFSNSMGKFGTAANVKFVNKAKMLPVWNYFFGDHDQALRISGEMIQKHHGTTPHTCKPCTIMCGHKGHFNGDITSVPEYETLTLLGSNIGVFDRDAIARFNDICNKMGMDTISAGGTLAWVMEALEKGFLDRKLMESEDMDLRFGFSNGIEKALDSIAHCRGFGSEMAMGSRSLSQKYGGRDFAMQVKGLEMAGYDPRGAYGLGLAYAVANRGACHLSASIMAFEVFLGLLKPDTTRGKPEFVKFVEDITCGVNALQTCQFTMYAYTLEPFLTKYTPDFVLKKLMYLVPSVAISLMDFSLYPDLFSSVTGIKCSSKDFLRAGERIHVLERYMNTREGISSRDDVLPDRVLMETIAGDEKKRMVPLNKMIGKYYRLRGYDKNGVPGKSLLGKLKIPSVPSRV